MSEFAPKQILCPVDLSTASTSVLSWARLFAQAFDSRVELLHADWSETPRYFTEDQVSALANQATRRRQTLRRDLEELAKNTLGGDVTFTISVVDGHAVEVVLQRLRENPPDLIVMGSHGHSGVARLLLGSVAENVVHEAHCPTLIVKGPEIPLGQKQLRRVLCPVNLSSLARECAEVSSAVASALGAELNVIQAVEDHGTPDTEIRQRLCQWLPGEARRRCRVSEFVRQGDAAEQIILFARQNAVNLIVLGAEHRSFLEFTTLGRTTERVLRHGPSSVLLVPHKQVAS
jgi:nucleotide-binding universal stress UspA family protein